MVGNAVQQFNQERVPGCLISNNVMSSLCLMNHDVLSLESLGSFVFS